MRKIFSLAAIVAALTCRCGQDPPRGPAPKWQVTATNERSSEEIEMPTCQKILVTPGEHGMGEQRPCDRTARWKVDDSGLEVCNECADQEVNEGFSCTSLIIGRSPQAST